MNVIDWATSIAIVEILGAMSFTLIRLIKGPSLSDRLMAFDLFMFLSSGFVGVYTIQKAYSRYLDVAIAISLFGFIGTVALARYIHARKDHREGDSGD